MDQFIQLTLRQGPSDRKSIFVRVDRIGAITDGFDAGGHVSTLHIGETHPLRVLETPAEILKLIGAHVRKAEDML